MRVLEQELKHSTHSKRDKNHKLKLLVLGSSILLLLATTSSFFLFINKKADPIPGNIRNSLNFPLYYPLATPQGYQYKKDSAKVENDILFYSLQSSDKIVTVTEQAISGRIPDLTQLPGFKSLETSVGSAVSGTNAGNRPAAIILSNTTLITINGTTSVAASSVNALAQSMHLLR